MLKPSGRLSFLTRFRDTDTSVLFKSYFCALFPSLSTMVSYLQDAVLDVIIEPLCPHQSRNFSIFNGSELFSYFRFLLTLSKCLCFADRTKRKSFFAILFLVQHQREDERRFISKALPYFPMFSTIFWFFSGTHLLTQQFFDFSQVLICCISSAAHLRPSSGSETIFCWFLCAIASW